MNRVLVSFVSVLFLSLFLSGCGTVGNGRVDNPTLTLPRSDAEAYVQILSAYERNETIAPDDRAKASRARQIIELRLHENPDAEQISVSAMEAIFFFGVLSQPVPPD